jgi:putative FmdB family regulatory protein
MPTYDYSCKQCGYKFEVLQKMSDAPLSTCPECKAPSFERGFGGGTGFQFKNGGSSGLQKAEGGVACAHACSCHPKK